MQLATVTGTVTATTKHAGFEGLKLLLTNVIDSDEQVLQSAVVAVDTCGAGVGDMVLIVNGSAARIAAPTSGVATDAAIVAIIDRVEVATST